MHQLLCTSMMKLRSIYCASMYNHTNNLNNFKSQIPCSHFLYYLNVQTPISLDSTKHKRNQENSLISSGNFHAWHNIKWTQDRIRLFLGKEIKLKPETKAISPPYHSYIILINLKCYKLFLRMPQLEFRLSVYAMLWGYMLDCYSVFSCE